MRLRVRALFALAAAAASGCHLNNVCGTTEQILTKADGGFWPCLTSEDCQRTANVFVCVSNADPDKDCVRCSNESRCVQISPKFCRQ